MKTCGVSPPKNILQDFGWLVDLARKEVANFPFKGEF